MKEAQEVEAINPDVAALVGPAMSAGAIATLLLVLRYLWVLNGHWRTAPNAPAVLVGWLAATLASLVGFWLMPWNAGDLIRAPAWLPAPYELWKLAWPMLTATVLAWMARRLLLPVPPIPAGDAVVLLERMTLSIRNRIQRAGANRSKPQVPRRATSSLHAWMGRRLDAGELLLRQKAAVAMLLLALLLNAL